jgi:DnaJ-class molecular chaperone
MPDTFECYKILDIEPGASAERIRRAYVELTLTWDPARYVNNPTLRAEAEKKRAEIEEAFNAIRFFLPELQDPPKKEESPRSITRDFKELERQTATEKAKMIMGILVAVVLFAIFAWALYLLVKGRNVAPVPPIPIE